MCLAGVEVGHASGCAGSSVGSSSDQIGLLQVPGDVQMQQNMARNETFSIPWASLFPVHTVYN